MWWTVLLIAQQKLCCMLTKFNFKASVMRHHMHTPLKVRIKIDFETVTLNNN